MTLPGVLLHGFFFVLFILMIGKPFFADQKKKRTIPKQHERNNIGTSGGGIWGLNFGLSGIK